MRWLAPAPRAPHESTGQLETGALHPDPAAASPRFRVAVTAACFADALCRDDDRPHLLGVPPCPKLAETAAALADRAEDPEVRDLADGITEASELGRQVATAIRSSCAGDRVNSRPTRVERALLGLCLVCGLQVMVRAVPVCSPGYLASCDA